MITSIDHPLNTVNFAIVRLPHMALAYSYQTCIAFSERGQWVARENEWGPTTGRHLNYIGVEKADRLSGKAFEIALKEALMHRLPTGEYV